MHVNGLVQDGIGYSRAKIMAKFGTKKEGVYQPVPQVHTDKAMAKRSGKSKGKSSSKEESKRSKKSTRQRVADRNGQRRDSSTDESKPQTIEPLVETAEEERERLLREERTTGVHSSQQAIKVVGLLNG